MAPASGVDITKSIKVKRSHERASKVERSNASKNALHYRAESHKHRDSLAAAQVLKTTLFISESGLHPSGRGDGGGNLGFRV